MPQVDQDVEAPDALQSARGCVREFFSSTEHLTPVQLAALGREQRRHRSRLSTDPDFLQAVCNGSWSSEHEAAARDIRREARSRAASLVAWPRRAALATALEETALVVLNDADPDRPLTASLCTRLRQPWDRAVGLLLPVQRPASA